MKIRTRTVIRKEYTGALVAVMIPKGFQDVLGVSKDSFPRGSKFVPRSEYHITLAYMGDASQIIRDGELPQVRQAIVDVANVTAPFWIYIGGTGRFSKVEDGKYDAIYAEVRSHGIEVLHRQLADRLNKISPKWKWDYDKFTPHMTLAYIPPGSKHTAEVPETEILMSTITLTLAGEAEDYTLRGYKNTISKHILTFNQV